MTKTDLHNIPGVQELPKHPPLVAVLTYLRAHHPGHAVDKADHWSGWYEALDAFESVCTPTQSADRPKQVIPYTQPKTEAK